MFGKSLVLLFALAFQSGAAQQLRVTKAEPPNWWAGMKLNRVQLMLYGTELSGASISCSTPGLRILGTQSTGNPSYLFVDVELAPTIHPGTFPLRISAPSGVTTLAYPILPRQNPNGRYQGFRTADVVYLITPDRFSDGDPSNNSVAGMLEGECDRTKPYSRHGGDIQGIINHLDYLEDLGVTALWINPLTENNNPGQSYHGYAASDLYNIDPRFGDNALYARLVDAAHARGLKIILDHVSNHISIQHPWLNNLPAPDWLNGTVKSHDRTRHEKVELTDPYADASVRRNLKEGWFADYMPDLNQRNPLLGRYLIQNTIWWIESTGLDGIREDTFPYSDDGFLAAWCGTIKNEYPNFNIVGEVWINDPVFLAPYQRGNRLARPFDAELPCVTDYGLFDAFMQVFGAHAGIGTLEACLAKDFLYPDPSNLLTFVDNHDVARIMEVTGGDIQRTKLALTILLTTRGIPELYYGTEIGLRGGRDHGRIRSDFPGGFPGDTLDAFTASGRTARQDSIFTYVRSLLHLRKEHPALSHGSLMQFPPIDDVYAYVRASEHEKILVLVNNGSGTKSFKFSALKDQISSARTLKAVLNGETFSLEGISEIEIPGNSARVYEVSSGESQGKR
jgi:glycosidase